MTIEPTGFYVLLKIQDSELKTPGGIILPETSKKPTQLASIVAVGVDAQRDFKAGQEVLFDQYSGVQCDIDGETYRIVRTNDILGIVSR